MIKLNRNVMAAFDLNRANLLARALQRGLILLMLLLCWLPAAPAANIDMTVYYHNDTAGSVVAATDGNGNLAWREHYRPYGDRVVKQPAGNNQLWFHNKPQDDQTGLSYFGARYYDPIVGRFMGVDPQHFDEDNLHSFNRYAYGNNNPYKFTDPTGQWSTEAHNYFIKEAFGQMPAKIITYIQEGSRAADAMYRQGPGPEHVHSMWGPGGSSEQMVERRAEYIKEQISVFGNYMKLANADRERGANNAAENKEAMAWRAYGKALHPIMDSTSPSHNQQWIPGRDLTRHGEGRDSQEAMRHAPKYRDETVRRMQNIGEFMR